MRKILSIILAAFMVLSMFAMISVSADEVDTSQDPDASAGTEGNWEVHVDAFEEAKIKDGEPSFQPRPGYHYTEDGFEIKPAVYNNIQAKYTVISKTKCDSKNFSIKIRLDDYAVEGDNWVSFSFWSEKHGLAQGSTNSDGSFGYGWYCLVRDASGVTGVKDGKLSVVETYYSGNKANPGGLMMNETIEFEPIIDENGIQYLEFEVKNYIIYINGTAIGQDTDACKNLRSAFKEDEYLAYFGISVKSGLANTPVKFSILDVDGVKPTGTDSQDPEVKTKEYGDMIDASTIPAGTPGVLFDASFEKQNTKLPGTSGCTVDLSESDTFKVTSAGYIGYTTFSVKDEYTVDIKDFPYAAIVLKNFCTCELEEGDTECYMDEVNGIYYCAGKILAPDDDYKVSVDVNNMIDITPEGSDDYYVLIFAELDTSVFEEGSRIHSLRFDFAGTKGGQEFEIVYAGYFRDKADIAAYAASAGYDLTVEKFPSQDEGETETDNWGTPPIDDETKDDETKPSNNSNKDSKDEDDEKKGCGSVVGMGAVAIIAVASVAGVVTFKKKKED